VSSLVHVACPLCGADREFLSLQITHQDLHIQKYGEIYSGSALSQWKTCRNCGFVHQNPRPSLEALEEFYEQGHYHAPDVPTNLEDYSNFADWYYREKVDYALAKRGMAGGQVFEIGCGLGGALRLFRDRGWDATGVEPDPIQARFASHALHLPGVRQGLVNDSFLLDTKVDLVFSNHAFEHFADLGSVMRAVTRVLKPGGYIFTAVPTYYSNRSRLSKLWMNSAHYSLFTHRSLNQLFARYGFQEVCHTYRGWHKEIDDLWHVAQFTGGTLDPSSFFEDAAAVQRYVDFYNPIRSIVYAPFYADYARRVAIYTMLSNAWNLLWRSPSLFFEKLKKKLSRILQGR
jgi:SAM-dependent methyltransferase